MENLIKLLVEQGIGLACVAYLMYFQSTTMKRLTVILESVVERLGKIETRLDIKEDTEQ